MHTHTHACKHTARWPPLATQHTANNSQQPRQSSRAAAPLPRRAASAPSQGRTSQRRCLPRGGRGRPTPAAAPGAARSRPARQTQRRRRPRAPPRAPQPSAAPRPPRRRRPASHAVGGQQCEQGCERRRLCLRRQAPAWHTAGTTTAGSRPAAAGLPLHVTCMTALSAGCSYSASSSSSSSSSTSATLYGSSWQQRTTCRHAAAGRCLCFHSLLCSLSLHCRCLPLTLTRHPSSSQLPQPCCRLLHPGMCGAAAMRTVRAAP